MRRETLFDKYKLKTNPNKKRKQTPNKPSLETTELMEKDSPTSTPSTSELTSYSPPSSPEQQHGGFEGMEVLKQLQAAKEII